MSRSLRIPWLVDLLRVDAGSDIAVLAADGRLDRRFEPRGPADQSHADTARAQRAAGR